MAAAFSASAVDLGIVRQILLWAVITVAILAFALACVLQAGFIYWKRYPRDRLETKALVIWLCVCCLTHCVVVVVQVATTMDALLLNPIDAATSVPVPEQTAISTALVWLYIPERLLLWLVAVPAESFFALRAIRMYSSRRLYLATILLCVAGSCAFLAIEIFRIVVMAKTGAPFSYRLAIYECAALWANAIFHGIIITLLLRQVLTSRAAEPKARSHHVVGIWSAALLETSGILAIVDLGLPITASFLSCTKVFPAKILFYAIYVPLGAYCVIYTLNTRRAVAERVDRRFQMANVRGTRDDPSTWKGDVSMVRENRFIVSPRQTSRSVPIGGSLGGAGSGFDNGHLIVEKLEEVEVFDPDKILLDETALVSVRPTSLMPSPRGPEHMLTSIT